MASPHVPKSRRVRAATALVVGAGLLGALGLYVAHHTAQSSPDSTHLAIWCMGHEVPPQALNNTSGAERSNDPAARALVAFLESPAASMGGGPPTGRLLPYDGWTLLFKTESQALFAARDRDAFHPYVYLEKKGTVWKWVGFGYSTCDDHVHLVDRDSPVVPWAGEQVSGTRVELHFASCLAPLGHADVVETSTTVTITVHVLKPTPAPYPVGCVPEDLTTGTIVLDHPLGGRQLLDGYFVPAIPPSTSHYR